VELDPNPHQADPHLLRPYELAARLSYFLWSSMPDAELFAAADNGSLLDPIVLSAQVTRMLANPKAVSLVDNFAGQWLFVRKLDEQDPDKKIFPAFDPPLRDAMKQEMQSMFREVLSGALPLNGFLDGEYTFINDRLAKHYGLPLPGTAQLTKTMVGASNRGGLLTQAGLLTVTSYPARTSPVQRGRWVMDQLLCTPLPDPPPGIEGLKTEAVPTGTLRQRLEQHRKDAVCAGCHATMDALGFGLENYDAIGAYRLKDAGFPIDSSGKLPDGRTFSGARPLGRLLAADPDYAHCLSEKLATFALGRGIGGADDAAIAGLAKGLVADAYNFPRLINAVVLSDVFRKRRGEAAPTMNAGGAK
jgi:hypothetical protein